MTLPPTNNSRASTPHLHGKTFIEDDITHHCTPGTDENTAQVPSGDHITAPDAKMYAEEETDVTVGAGPLATAAAGVIVLVQGLTVAPSRAKGSTRVDPRHIRGERCGKRP